MKLVHGSSQYVLHEPEIVGELVVDQVVHDTDPDEEL